MDFELQRSEIKNRPRVIKVRKDFLGFCERNHTEVMDFVANTAACIPEVMYKQNDYRMLVGTFTSRMWVSRFANFEDHSDNGHDVIYTIGNIEDDYISMKFNKQLNFQRKISYGLTKPREITVKNSRTIDKSRKLGLSDLNFSHLFVMNYEWNKDYDEYQNSFLPVGNIKVAFGVATTKTVLDHLTPKAHKSHMVNVALKNKEWDYFSGFEYRMVKHDPVFNNNIFNIKLTELLIALNRDVLIK